MDLLPKVFRTEGDMAEFDPTKILDSIIKETNMNEEDAKHITELVVRRIISSGIRFLSGPHIREIVCSILSEQHFENERKLYTRIGMPLMDYEEFLEKFSREKPKKIINPEKIHHWAANQIAEEYAHLRILSDEESQAHLYGDIHIHKLKYFDLRPLSQEWDPRLVLKNGLPPISGLIKCCRSKPAGNLRTAIQHLLKWLAMTQNEFYGTQGFNLITAFLAPYIKKMPDDEISQIMRNAIYEINQLPVMIGRDVSLISMSTCPAIIEELADIPAIGSHGEKNGIYSDFYNECLRLFNVITSIYQKGDDNESPFEAPKHEVLLDRKWIDEYDDAFSNIWEEISSMRTPFLTNLCSDLYRNKFIENLVSNERLQFGMLQDICLNLPRYAYLSKDEDKFMEVLNEKMDLCSKILLKKYEIIKKRLNTNHLPLCGGIADGNPIFKLENQKLSICFVGLNETIKHLTGYQLHEDSNAFNLGKRIVNEMKNTCLEFSNRDNKIYSLNENASKKAIYRFARLDLKHFPGIAIPQSSRNMFYYTNSAHFREDAELALLEKVKKQGEFHSLIQNDVIEYVPLNELKKIDMEISEFIKKIFTSSKIACLKFFS